MVQHMAVEGAAVAGDGLDHHRGAHVALAAAAEPLGMVRLRRPMEASALKFFCAGRYFIALDGVGAQGGLAQGDQVGLRRAARG